MKVSAYIPCYNNAATVALALDALRSQTVPPDEIWVVDDGSTDGSVQTLSAGEYGLIQHSQNLGRGAARAAAMERAKHDLVVCCDACNVLDRCFIENALPCFNDKNLAGLYGRITQPPPKSAVERWRGRHLFKMGQPNQIRHGALLATYGAVVRKSLVQQVGGYNSRMRHSEDGELGERLLKAGYDVIYNPNLTACYLAHNSISQILERYWRWHAGFDEKPVARAYARSVWFSIKVMAREDFQNRDPRAALISLFCPHYQFWKSFVEKHHV